MAMRVRASLRNQAMRHMAKMAASLEGVHMGANIAASRTSGDRVPRAGIDVMQLQVPPASETKASDRTTLERRHSRSLPRGTDMDALSMCSQHALDCR